MLADQQQMANGGEDSINLPNETGSNSKFKKPGKKTVKHAVKAASKLGPNGSIHNSNTAFI